MGVSSVRGPFPVWYLRATPNCKGLARRNERPCELTTSRSRNSPHTGTPLPGRQNPNTGGSSRLLAGLGAGAAAACKPAY